jgi:hypothetical protein
MPLTFDEFSEIYEREFAKALEKNNKKLVKKLEKRRCLKGATDKLDCESQQEQKLDNESK